MCSHFRVFAIGATTLNGLLKSLNSSLEDLPKPYFRPPPPPKTLYQNPNETLFQSQKTYFKSLKTLFQTQENTISDPQKT